MSTKTHMTCHITKGYDQNGHLDKMAFSQSIYDVEGSYFLSDML